MIVATNTILRADSRSLAGTWTCQVAQDRNRVPDSFTDANASGNCCQISERSKSNYKRSFPSVKV